MNAIIINYSVPLSPCLVAFLLTAVPSFAQGDKPAAPLKAKFHQDLRGPDPQNPNLRKLAEGVTWGPAGARLMLPAGQGKLPAAGLATNFQVKGDFEITASYEIINADLPTEGYGNGV